MMALGLTGVLWIEATSDSGWPVSEADAGDYLDGHFGDRGWSWLPPGPTCAFTGKRHGFERTDVPGLIGTFVLMSVMASMTGIALAIGWWAVNFSRRARHDR